MKAVDFLKKFVTESSSTIGQYSLNDVIHTVDLSAKYKEQAGDPEDQAIEIIDSYEIKNYLERISLEPALQAICPAITNVRQIHVTVSDIPLIHNDREAISVLKKVSYRLSFLFDVGITSQMDVKLQSKIAELAKQFRG